MRNMVISLALGAGAIFAFSAADAAPLTKGLAMLPNDNIENVRPGYLRRLRHGS